MARTTSWNPLAFAPAQVTLLTSALYIALFAVLLWVHSTVPSAPSDPTPIGGINLTSAWLDLSYISDGHHPVDSRRNEVVRGYLLKRIEEVLEGNDVDHRVVLERAGRKPGNESMVLKPALREVTVFDDRRSNVTFLDDFRRQPWTCYSESTNVMVYIRGSEDPKDDWWENNDKYEGQGGVLVNAHYDSVSSGYGATDDGVGVVTILQLLSYFTTEGNQPKRGLVLLLNNNEEDGLYGAKEYLRHPLSEFTHMFLNLEGAGAGGRAMLFRSTDAEVTKFYTSPNPFGNIVSGDGFKRGFVRSGTDYSVFNGDNRMRGIDVAFFEPRARYHTDQDDARDTSVDSLWHMLSAALETTEAMTSYEGDQFDGSTRRNGKLDISSGSDSAYFDLLGKAFAVMRLQTLFALSVSLLVAGPVLLIVLEVILRKSDKWYPLSTKHYLHSSDDDEAVHFSGMRGLFRFPLAFVVATAAVLALAYLLTKINPFIIYNSEYAVWAMMLSAWFAVGWFFLAGADRVRPTALQRMFSIMWLYSLTWVMLVAATVGENNFDLGSGYFVVIYNAATFAALLVSYLELLALPTKTSYVEHVSGAEQEVHGRSGRPGSRSSRSVLSSSRRQPSGADDDDDDEATERSGLLGASDRRSGNTFVSKIGKRSQVDEDADASDDKYLNQAYGDEQPWSSKLPRWTWVIQLILLAPINIIIIGQISLLLTSALHMTPADGNPVLPIYLFIAVLALLLLLPLTPFLHRVSYRIATFMFLVFVGCLIYNLLAFPFSSDARLKIYFVQRIDLNAGSNDVIIAGLDGYIQDIIGELPSAAGQDLKCGIDGPSGKADRRSGLQTCSWHGLAPNVLANEPLETASFSKNTTNDFASWLDYNVTAANGTANFSIRGRNTKQCRIVFDNLVSEIHIDDAALDPRYKPVAEKGSEQIRLFSREWDKTFEVDVSWPSGKTKGQKGKVMCMWNDVNAPGVIPAYDEVRRFQPVWSAVTKASDGLVEGWKGFEI
ncbi:uncharacterized protein LTR77_002496 [Saxophila tyrrhenica]|uniref:Peptide hydrolase n=1 Tax=Saxophila tyrrhenica TaxID=1690608 RepID=A0AAV9PLU1_9PEZI|nr:hypothetical protein LTR77_002496 [Saxophila tyrrhenica]